MKVITSVRDADSFVDFLPIFLCNPFVTGKNRKLGTSKIPH
jgi:hypothetical protein